MTISMGESWYNAIADLGTDGAMGVDTDGAMGTANGWASGTAVSSKWGC